MKLTVWTQDKELRSMILRWSLVGGLWLLWMVLLQFVHDSRLNASIQNYISQPVQFQIREKLGKTPALTPRLKVFGLDDQTIAFLEDDEIRIDDFTLMLENIARQKPRAIILDRLFGKSPKHSELASYLQRLQAINVPIYAGSYFNQRAISYRSSLEINEKQYSPQAYSATFHDMQLPPHIKTSPGYLYGYAPEYQGIFTQVGHISLNDDGAVYPFIQSEQGWLIPHIALLAADFISLRQGELYANEVRVPMTEDGTIFINHRPVMEYYRGAKSLRPVIARARHGSPETLVQEGDTVLILFNFYTGSTDFFSGGPFGEIPGGMIVATVIDSIIQGKWLKTFQYENLLIGYFCLLGVIVGWQAGAISFWIISILMTLIYFAFSTLMFSYTSMVIPWVLPLVGFIGSGVLFYVHNRVGSEIKKVQIEKDYYSEKALRLEEENKKIKLAERLNLGRAVQEILLPPDFSFEFAGYQIGMRYSPAQEMSGDWIYHWQSHENEQRLLIGDVVGKGPSAAIPVAVIVGILGECERLSMEPEETLRRLNQRLLELFHKQITTTCTMVVLQQNSQLTFYNAGSPGWFLVGEKQIDYLSLRSSPLGINEEFEPSAHQMSKFQDLTMLTFTDGYLEGSRGFRRLQKALSKIESTHLSAERLHQILDEVGVEFRLEDDRSLLTIRCLQVGENQTKTLDDVS
ncbi:MAG: SpoIIE family protein phosphatase [Oligoflexus sp.]